MHVHFLCRRIFQYLRVFAPICAVQEARRKEFRLLCVHSCVRGGMRAWNGIYLFIASRYEDSHATHAEKRMPFGGGYHGAIRQGHRSTKM